MFDALSARERLDVLRTLSRRLAASRHADEAWVGRGLVAWLSTGTPLDALLGLRGKPGARRPASRLRLELQRAALRDLINRAGGVAAALAALGGAPCGEEVRNAVATARALGAAASRRSLSRAAQAGGARGADSTSDGWRHIIRP